MDTISFNIPRNPGIILQAKRLCHDVYLQMGYIDRPCPGGVLPGHDSDCTYIVAFNKYEQVIGTVRLSRQVPSTIFEAWKDTLFASCGSLISNAFRQSSFSIGSLAVNKAYANMKISRGLYQMAYEWAQGNEMAYGILSMDHRAFRALRMMGWHAIQVGEAAWYFGSPTIPAIIAIREQKANVGLSHLLNFMPVEHRALAINSGAANAPFSSNTLLDA